MTFDFYAAYEELNPADDDYRFYADLARSLDARRVLDLGCGTGVLAVMIAAQGRQVTGIDPDPAMLDIARAKSGSDKITWVQGFSDCAGTDSADLAVMSGHVAQIFVTDSAWMATLTNLRRALSPGGVLAFESRNPTAEGWKRWNRADTLRTISSSEGQVEFWHETVAVDLPVVTYDTFSREIVSDREKCTRSVLAFRTQDELEQSLNRAGFSNNEFYGSWDFSPVDRLSPEIIVVAKC